MEKFKKITFDYNSDEIEDLLGDKVKQTLDFKIEKYKSDLLYSLYDCESPIEQIMALELKDIEILFISSELFEILGNTNQAYIECNKNKYRVDFLLEIAFKHLGQYKDVLKLIIECDGHEFHEKTKDQVKKNNKRDRDLQNSGYEILHFSGSEIYNDSSECKNEIVKFIKRKYLSYMSKIIER